MRLLYVTLFALATVGCLDDEGAGDDLSSQFIANGSDFDGFPTWPNTSHFTSSIAPVGIGVYANGPTPTRAAGFPQRFMVVKVIGDETAPPSSWMVHAMVKRGGGYGAAAAPGWEFFSLGVTDSGAVVVRGRGDGTDASTYVDLGDMSADRNCVFCHELGDANDFVLTPALQLTP